MGKNASGIALGVALLIIGFVFGFFLGKNYSLEIKPIAINSQTPINQLVDSQTASMMGQITEIQGNTLTVKNAKSNNSGTVPVSNKVIVIKPGLNSKTASSSAGLNAIELNKDVVINMELVNGEYTATVIQYPLPLPPMPSIKPTPQAALQP